MRLKSIVSLCTLTLVASVQCINAAATRIAFVDPFATARGNAFTATADNPSAVFYNAAGLTQLEGTTLQANVFAISLDYDYKGPGVADSMDNAFQPIPSFFLAHRFADKPLALGFGVYAPFGMGADWGANASFATADPRVPYEADLKYVKYHAVIAWQVSDTLSLSAGVSYDDSDIDVKSIALRYDGSANTLGYSLALHWKPHPMHAFGLNYQAKTSMNYGGNADVMVAPGVYVPLPARAKLVYPESITFGYSFRPNERWNFEFNADWTHWDRVNALVLDGVPGAAYNLNWESAFIWEFGVTRYFADGWHLSGGYTYVENAVPDRDFLPIVPDSDRHFFALGLGRSYENWRWQATYQYAYASDRRVTGNTFTPADGKWGLDSQAFAFSLGYRF